MSSSGLVYDGDNREDGHFVNQSLSFCGDNAIVLLWNSFSVHF